MLKATYPLTSTPNLKDLDARIDRCMLSDRRPLRRRLVQLGEQFKQDDLSWGFADAIARLEQAIQSSIQQLERRAQTLPQAAFPEELPISARRDEIARALNEHQVVIVCGETGSGKSTQLPKLCLALGRGISAMIGHTQPRRIAARTLAMRIASELGSELGQAVGYKVRFNDRIGPDTYIKLMTDGILLAETESDRWLEHYDTLIIDEAHERSLNIDLLLGYLKTVLPRRPDLKLIVTSATLDPERFSRHFDNAPIIEVSGRTYPVEVRYRPLYSQDENERDRSLEQAILEAADEISKIDRGDILVFLPGEREIRETAQALRKHHPPDTEILPLYARLSAAEQNRVFQPHNRRHIVLATNVAETSLTVPGVRYVIDTGLARINRYSPRTKVQRLVCEPIARASADQRKGRCGRQSCGICYRLYAAEDFEARAQFTDPEILRTNLASVILRLKSLHFGEVEDFPFIDPPDSRYVKAGYKLLEELGAVDEARQLTASGRQLARLPLDPRLGRMLLAGQTEHCLAELLIIVSALSVQDPRERPLEASQKADEAHHPFADERSDFLWYLNLWRFYEEQARHLSKNKLRTLCTAHFLSYRRLQEWQDIHSQLKTLIHDLGFNINTVPADYAAIHRALLKGLLGNIGFKTEKNEYTGARGIKFSIFPGASLFKKAPAWIMAAEIAETSRLYARTVAKIEPEWIEQVAGPLLKRSYCEPHWEKRAGRVQAFERVTLYGLTLVARRKVDYTRIYPVECRRLFIQAALVEGDYETRAAFFQHNRGVLEQIEDLQHRLRRLDILIDERDLFDFYDQRLPEGVVCAKTFERWRTQAEGQDPKLLYMDRAQLLQAHGQTADRYPDALNVAGMALPLSYRFEPGHEADGVTVTVPVVILNQLDPARFDWLVPGLLKEKITQLIRSLPKSLRRHFVPTEHYTEACLKQLKPTDQSLTASLAAQLQQLAGVAIPKDAWQTERLPAYLRVNYRIVDPKRRLLAEGRDLAVLQRKLGGQAQTALNQVSRWPIEREGITAWDFGELPQMVERIEHEGLKLKGFPALVDKHTSVAIRVFQTSKEATLSGRPGIRRLFMLALSQEMKYLQKSLPGFGKMALYYANLGQAQALQSELMAAIIDRVFLGEGWDIRSEQVFKCRLEEGKTKLMTTANQVCEHVAEILTRFHALQKTLREQTSLGRSQAVAEIRDQMDHLICRGFITTTPPQWLEQIPRYLKAIALRLERLDRDPIKDRQKAARIQPLWQAYKERLKTTQEIPELVRFRWLLEEFRVSVFAPELGTLEPVSEARLAKQWDLGTAG
jgi:ATP-dependent RNA helicase HrpA